MNADFRRWAIACLYVVGFGIAGALLLQHWMHLPVLLPYLIFLACPLMHIFMMRGHSHHHGREEDGKQTGSGPAA